MKKNLQCVGIIMDGNRRWAKEKGLSTLEGHLRGYKKIESVIQWVRNSNIENVIVYAFSTENWNRSEKEVRYLMNLFCTALTRLKKKAIKEKIRLRFIGQRERFSEELQNLIDSLEIATAHFSNINVTMALSYGGRTELVRAVQRIIDCGEKKITEEVLENNLWTAGIPDPDIIIRTGGEKRLSNFLTWQSVYSELFFSDTYWPDFSEEEFSKIVSDYKARNRKFGK